MLVAPNLVSNRSRYNQAVAGLAFGAPVINADVRICALVGAIIGGAAGYVFAQRAKVPALPAAGLGAATVALLAYFACRKDAEATASVAQQQGPAYQADVMPAALDGYSPVTPSIGPEAAPPGVGPSYVPVVSPVGVPSPVPARPTIASTPSVQWYPGAQTAPTAPGQPPPTVATTTVAYKEPWRTTQPVRQLPAPVPTASDPYPSAYL